MSEILISTRAKLETYNEKSLEQVFEKLLQEIVQLVTKTGITMIQAFDELMRIPDEKEIALENESLRQVFLNLFEQSVYKN